jgi:type I restriction enzyme, S subunit
MNDLPEGWVMVALTDLGAAGEQAVLTGPFGSNMGREDFTHSGIPVFTIGCLGADGIVRSKLLHVSPATAKQLQTYRLKEGDFLFSRMASVGRAGIVPPGLSGAFSIIILCDYASTKALFFLDYFSITFAGHRSFANIWRQ